jgi:hypothetical protein
VEGVLVLSQITNIPDAISDIVAKMQPLISFHASNGGSPIVTSLNCYGYDTEHYHYADIAGLYIEFYGFYGKRYKVASCTEDRIAGTLVITLTEQLNTDATQCRLFLNFMYGHKEEIEARLLEQAQDVSFRDHKYPLLILFDPIKEKKDGAKTFYIDAKINLVLVNYTNKLWKASDRLTYNFKAILHPYYELFMNFLNTSSICQSDLTHDKIDRYFYSESEAKKQNVFAAELDAIEIINLDFKLLKYFK